MKNMYVCNDMYVACMSSLYVCMYVYMYVCMHVCMYAIMVSRRERERENSVVLMYQTIV